MKLCYLSLWICLTIYHIFQLYITCRLVVLQESDIKVILIWSFSDDAGVSLNLFGNHFVVQHNKHTPFLLLILISLQTASLMMNVNVSPVSQKVTHGPFNLCLSLIPNPPSCRWSLRGACHSGLQRDRQTRHRPEDLQP